MLRILRLLSSTVLFLSTFSSASGQEATFEGLGDLPDGPTFSVGQAVSPDGSVVVGWSNSDNGTEAFRWEGGEIDGLGDLPGKSFFSQSFGVSPSGSVVVGTAAGEEGDEAFRWTEETGMEGLGHLPGGTLVSSSARDVSDTGSVIVGRSDSENGSSEAFRWTEGGGIEGLGDLDGGSFFSRAHGVSADGTVIVGRGRSGEGHEAFRWTEAEGMEGLGFLPGGFSSEAYDVSSDGSVVVGESRSEDGTEAFRWEAASGEMVGLGDFEGGDLESVAFGVSEDGSVAVGYGNPGTSASDRRAAVWTEAGGLRDLKDVLENEFDLDLDGWTLREARGISSSGTVIVGFGNNPNGNLEGWRAEAPFTVAGEDAPDEIAEVLTVPVPNPVHETATFSVAVERGQRVTVEAFDVLGRSVQTLYEGALAAGTSETLRFDASSLPAGVYILQAAGEEVARTRRVTVVR